MDFIQSLEPAIATEMQGWLDDGKTYQDISNVLQGRFPGVTRRLSERSVRRFCRTKCIQKRRGMELDSLVCHCVDTVGNSRLHNVTEIENRPTFYLPLYCLLSTGWTYVWQKTYERTLSCYWVQGVRVQNK